MPVVKVYRRGIEAFAHMAMRNQYQQHDNVLHAARPATPVSPLYVTTLDWPSYTDEQIQGLVEMCRDAKARVAPRFESDVCAEAARRNLAGPTWPLLTSMAEAEREV